MTIKKRIVIWYTVWMAVLAAIMLSIVISGSEYLLRRGMMEDMLEEIQDAAEDIIVHNGQVYADPDGFFDDGIYISVIAPDGTFMGGSRQHWDLGIPVSIGSFREVDTPSGAWFVFDEAGDGGTVIRGMARAVYGDGSYIGSMHLLAVILLPVILLFAAMGGYFIVRRSFLPADRAIAAADEIIGSDDLSKRIGLGEGSDEIHRMASAFDSMLERLEAAFEKERQFTSDASHELRTPISVIMAECEYALSHPGDEARQREALENIHRQGGKMSALVSELLSIARADKGTLRPSYEAFNLPELGEMVLASMEDRAGERGISLAMKAGSSLMVEADQGMITRVLINYISNAIAYGREGGWVLLRCRQDGDDAEISVEDNGIGISEDEIPRIWDRFYQSDASRSSSSGAGLGLPIVKAIASIHGGSAWVESSLGEGSTFYFRFPIRKENHQIS